MANPYWGDRREFAKYRGGIHLQRRKGGRAETINQKPETGTRNPEPGTRKADAEITESDVKDFCRGQIARYKIPKHVAFVDSFPLTASGKVQKYKLQERSVERFPDAEAG